MGAGELRGLDEARKVVRNSFEVVGVEPRGGGEWEEAYGKYKKVAG